MSAPLDGLRVVDFSELLPGPFLSQCLVEMGAEVTKVERPTRGDGLRRSSPGVFGAVNRGKSSVVLNLKEDGDRAKALDLVRDADVMIEGFRPGVMDRLGLGWDAVAAVNPGCVYISMSGFGASGPWVNAPGHDLNYLALAGVTALCGAPNGAPDHTFGLPVADLGGALYGLSSVLAALLQRDRTGEGQWIDLSITDCLAHWVNTRRAAFHQGDVHTLADQRHLALVRPAYGVFACTDGAVSVASLEDHFWAATCQALDMGRFAEDAFATLSARRAEAEAINTRLASQIAPMSRDTAMALFTKHDVPASPVLTPDEAAVSDHFAAREMMVDTAAGPITRFPVRLKGMTAVSPTAPRLGEGA